MADQAVANAPIQNTAEMIIDNLAPKVSTKALNLKLVRSYRKGGGTVFVYGVHGPVEKLEEFKAVQGSYYREDEETGHPLFFSSTFIEENTVLALRRDNSGFYPQTDLVEEAQLIESKAVDTVGKLEGIRRFAGIGKKAMADKMMASLLG